MKIPADAVDRYLFYMELKDKLFASEKDRHSFYNTMRSYVEYGCADNQNQDDEYTIFNNLGAHLDLLSSMLYAQDTTRFSLQPDATESADVFEKLPICAQRIQQEWHDSNADIIVGDAVFNSLGTASSFIKLVWNEDGVDPYIVDPENMGVLRENIAMLSRQQAIGEKYQITQSALRTKLLDHPKSEDLLGKITFNQKNDDRNDQQGGVAMSSFSETGNMIGNVGMPAPSVMEPGARTIEPMTDMVDLWIWDDAEQQYRVVTMADPGVVIYDRIADDGSEKPLFLRDELPYIQLCPNPSMKYFYGHSEAAKLRGLQDWLTERLWGIRRMLKRQANPPKVGEGLFGDDAEIAEQLTTPGGYVPGSGMGNMKLEELSPQIPDDLFRDVMNIMEMFNQTSGLPKAIQGQGEPGVRSEGHALNLIRTGSTRVKKKALRIEDGLEKIATLIWKLLRRYSKDHLLDTNGKPFLMNQVSGDVEVKVDAHSSSPAFIEDMKQWAADMFKAGLIDSDGYFDLTNPPHREILKAKSREMQKSRAIAEQKEKQDEKVLEFQKIRQRA